MVDQSHIAVKHRHRENRRSVQCVDRLEAPGIDQLKIVDLRQLGGLDRRARSISVLSVCVATGQWDEFRLHLRGALNNGLTKDEIREILIQCAIYASVPAANHAFKEADAFFRDAGV